MLLFKRYKVTRAFSHKHCNNIKQRGQTSHHVPAAYVTQHSNAYRYRGPVVLRPKEVENAGTWPCPPSKGDLQANGLRGKVIVLKSGQCFCCMENNDDCSW